MEEVEIDVGNDASSGGVFEEVDAFGIAERKDEEERRHGDGEASIVVERVTEQRIARERVEESIPLIAWVKMVGVCKRGQ